MTNNEIKECEANRWFSCCVPIGFFQRTGDKEIWCVFCTLFCSRPALLVRFACLDKFFRHLCDDKKMMKREKGAKVLHGRNGNKHRQRTPRNTEEESKKKKHEKRKTKKSKPQKTGDPGTNKAFRCVSTFFSRNRTKGLFNWTSFFPVPHKVGFHHCLCVFCLRELTFIILFLAL
jgi:hypothetical protein